MLGQYGTTIFPKNFLSGVELSENKLVCPFISSISFKDLLISSEKMYQVINAE